MYAVTHLKVAEARARFGEILDEAEQGATVVIERRGVRFRLVAEVREPSAGRAAPLFEFVDEDILGGQWSWAPSSTGLRLKTRRRR